MISRHSFGEIAQLCAIFWFKCCWGFCRGLGGGWNELDGGGWSWVKLGGGGWSWAEVSARFSNTRKQCKKSKGTEITRYNVWLISLSFEDQVISLCKKDSQKLHARIVSYMDLPKRKVLMKEFFTFQFNYCSLIWMLDSRILNNPSNNIQERTLTLTY